MLASSSHLKRTIDRIKTLTIRTKTVGIMCFSHLCDGDVLDELVFVEVQALGQQLVLLLTMTQSKHVTVAPTVHLKTE